MLNSCASTHFFSIIIILLIAISFFFINISYEDSIYLAYIKNDSLTDFEQSPAIEIFKIFCFFVFIIILLYAYRHYFTICYIWIKSKIPDSVKK